MGDGSSVCPSSTTLREMADIRCLMKLMRENAVLNVSTPNLHIAEYDWGEIPGEVPVEQADVILAADCVYFEVRLAFSVPFKTNI